MKNKNRFISVISVSFLFYISVMILLSSCSNKTESVNNKPTSTPTEAKMESQSGNWKVTVSSVKKIPKEVRSANSNNQSNQADKSKNTILMITLEATYIGTSGNVESPVVVLNYDKSRSFAALDVTATVPNSDDSAVKESFEILNWFQHNSQQKTRLLKGGEIFTLTYTFEDPKEYTNLKLVFGDVSPISLNPPL